MSMLAVGAVTSLEDGVARALKYLEAWPEVTCVDFTYNKIVLYVYPGDTLKKVKSQYVARVGQKAAAHVQRTAPPQFKRIKDLLRR